MSSADTNDASDGWRAAFDARWPLLRQRLGSAGLALALEALLLLVLLTLGQGIAGPGKKSETLTSVTFAPDSPAPEPEAEREQTRKPAPAAMPRVAPAEQPPRPSPLAPAPLPMPTPAAVLPVAPSAPLVGAPAVPKIGVRLRDEASGPAGAAGASMSGDSQVVGSGPNGQPVYAARWYREPTRQELAGYLSTVSNPGWATINCRTVPGWRVEDCYLLDQYPDPGTMGRAVLAAAWQFQVRPPVRGGRSLVGEWVRIRITYELKRSAG